MHLLRKKIVLIYCSTVSITNVVLRIDKPQYAIPATFLQLIPVPAFKWKMAIARTKLRLPGDDDDEEEEEEEARNVISFLDILAVRQDYCLQLSITSTAPSSARTIGSPGSVRRRSFSLVVAHTTHIISYIIGNMSFLPFIEETFSSRHRGDIPSRYQGDVPSSLVRQRVAFF